MKDQLKYSSLAAAVLAANAMALPVLETDTSTLNLAVDGGVLYAQSQESYAQFRGEEDSVSWQEGYLKVGLDGSHNLGASSVYGGVSLSSTGTWGDGDAAGFTNGKERRTAVENAFVGWKSGNLIEALGEDGLDISFGRQTLVIGDGFLINGDALNVGQGAEDAIGIDGIDRGGAYWMGGSGRSAFDKTLVVRVGGNSGVRADLFKVESDNLLQGETGMTGANLEYVGEQGTFALLHFKSESDGKMANAARDGMKTTSVRYQGSAGVENLFLSAEFAHQKNDDTTGRGGYVEAGWTFSGVPMSPQLTYRYSTFDENFDPLFFGFNRGYGTWFQGEVASNYAGPFNVNTDVQHLSLKASASEALHFGALYFDFSDHEKVAGKNMDAQEIDLYVEYFLNDNMLVSPLLGFFTPDADSANGGSQIGSDDTNMYAQLGFFFFY